MLISQSRSEVDIFLSRYNNPNTVQPYRLALGRLYSFLTAYGYTSLNHINLEVLELFKADLEMDYSPKTCSMTIGTVKEFFKFLMARGVIDRNETTLIKCTQVNSREQKTEVLTEHEVGKILDVIYNLEDKYQSHANRIMILLMVNGGLRVRELTHLRFKHLTLQNGRYTLKILGKGMKFRYITLSQSVSTEIEVSLDYLGIKGNQLIVQGNDLASNSDNSKPLNHKSVFSRIRKLALKAGIDKALSPHSLRRTCATIMYKRGTPIEAIMRVLGHENVATTHRYLDMDVDKDVSAKYSLDLTKGSV